MRIVLGNGQSTVTDGELDLNAAGHYRLRLPGQELARAGHEVFECAGVKFAGRRFVGVLPGGEVVEDVDVLLLKWSAHLGTPFFLGVAAARRNGQVIVEDVDDWPYEDMTGPFGVLNRQNYFFSFAQSDALIASTPYVAKRLSGLKSVPPITVLPTCFDSRAWASVPVEDVSDGPVLGFAGTPAFRPRDVGLLKPWLGTFLEKYDLPIVHAGHSDKFDTDPVVPAHETFSETVQRVAWQTALPRMSFAARAGIDPERVESRPEAAWRAYPTSGLLAGWDIGLIPMVDKALNRGKSACKGVEFLARGIPFIASPNGAYSSLGAGLMAGTSLADQPPSAWIAALEQLLDPAERQRVAAEAQAVLPANDIAVQWPKWESALQELVDLKRAHNLTSAGTR